jgi:hypothetical protein
MDQRMGCDGWAAGAELEIASVSVLTRFTIPG